MRQKKKEKLIEKMIASLYDGLDISDHNQVITKDILDKLVRNIAKEIINAQSVANQAMY